MKKNFVSIFLCFYFANDLYCNEDILKRLIVEHKNASAYFKTLSCDIYFQTIFPEKKSGSFGKYIKSGDLVVVNQGSETTGMDHFLIKGGEIRGVGRSRWEGGEPTSFNAFRWPNSQNVCSCDVWDEMLLNFPLSSGPNGTLEDLVRSVKSNVKCSEIIKDGKKSIELNLKIIRGASTLDMTYWFDVSRNYLNIERECKYPTAGSSANSKIVEFFEVSPGIYFPKKEVRVFLRDGKKFQERTATISNLEVNQPIPQDLLALPEIPEGTLLTDEVQGKRGYVDSNWNWIGKVGKSGGTQTLPSFTGSGDANQAQSAGEPWEMGTIIWFSGSAILAVLGLVFLVKFFKQ